MLRSLHSLSTLLLKPGKFSISTNFTAHIYNEVSKPNMFNMFFFFVLVIPRLSGSSVFIQFCVSMRLYLYGLSGGVDNNALCIKGNNYITHTYIIYFNYVLLKRFSICLCLPYIASCAHFSDKVKYLFSNNWRVQVKRSYI